MDSWILLLAENDTTKVVAGIGWLNLVSVLGLVVMVGLAWLISSARWQVNWRLVVSGLALQLVLASILFQSQTWTLGGRYPGGILYYGINAFFGAIKSWSDEGAAFVFAFVGDQAPTSIPALTMLTSFAFGVIPTVIFFAALMSVLYYVGIMQWLVKGMAWVMQRVMGTSGAESLAAAANVFVGHTEAPLVVRPYVERMTRSELNALMVGGFATITGGLMAVFASMGVSAGHLVVASIVSAPAALVIAKILQPELEQPETMGDAPLTNYGDATNIVEAAANGASEGLKLALNIVGMLIAFVALVAMLNALIGLVGWCLASVWNLIARPDELREWNWSLRGLFGLLFWPLAWVMGIAPNECLASGQMLGTKTVLNEFLAYDELVKTELSPRTRLIMTYALCGFSNFGAIGIQLGGIGAMAPNRKKDLAQLGLRAMFGGMLACCMTACLAGLLYGVFTND